ncbi:MAG: class I SAM-dependent rRNA methyltransferase, partial [Planctomycetota bacterium]
DFDDGKAKYHDINKLALPLVKEGGFYLSCSCSGLLEPLTFQEILRRAARLRTVRIERETGAGPDHPVRIDFPEGRYLKALWAQLD